MSYQPDTATNQTERERRSAGTMLRYVAAAILVVGALAVALDNSQRVEVGYLFGDRRAPLWFVMLAAAVAGALIAWLVEHRPHRRR